MSGIEYLLDTETATNVIEGIFTLLCWISGVVGDRFRVCGPMINQFYINADGRDVLRDYIFTKERICTEKLGVC